MEEAVETVVAESSPAPEAKPKQDPLEMGPMVTWTREQRNEFRTKGTMPEKPKADPAPAPKTSEAPAESAAESEAAKQQEATKSKPKQTAAERIAELRATIAKIEKGAGIKTEAESSPAEQTKPQPQPQSVEKEPTPEDTNADGTPKFKSYEEYTKALARWEIRQELAEERRRTQQEAQARETGEKLAQAKTRYGDEAVKIIDDTAGVIINDKDISPVVTQMLRESDILTDLLYTIGSKPEELASFTKMAKESPGKALRYIALTESLIREELEGQKAAPTEKVEYPPAKPQTSAPKPPAEVGGRGSAPPDALVSAAQANDYRAFKRELNRRSLASLKAG